MEKFIQPYFTDQQKWIISKRKDNVLYADICRDWPFNDVDDSSNMGANLRKKERHFTAL